jgi:membrane protein
MSWKKSWSILKGTCSEFSQDNVLRLSAALAYYSIFSLGPLLIIIVGVAGLVLGQESVRRQVEQQLQSMMGQNSAHMIESMMSAQQRGGSSLWATIIGIVILLFGASGVFGQLQDALNTIWGVKSKPGGGLWKFIQSRFLSLSMVLGIGFLLLISMALTTVLTAASGAIGSHFGFSETLGHVVNFIVSFVVITVLFAMIFKYLPDVKVPFRRVWVGALLTALLFTIGKYLLALYLGRASTTSSYGAAGSVIVILMWIYYASVILLFGAEFTHVYVRQTGTQVVPAKYAEPMTEKERAEQGMPGRKGAGSAAPSAGPLAAGRPSPERRPPSLQPAYSSVAPAHGPEPRWRLWGLLLAAGVATGMLLHRKPRPEPVRG